MGKVGSIRSVSLDGFSYDVFADSPANKKPGVKNEAIPTSGNALIKQMVQIPAIEGLVIKIPGVKEREQLEFSADKGDVKVVITYRNKDTDYAMGTFDIDSIEMTEGKATVNIYPDRPVTSQSA